MKNYRFLIIATVVMAGLLAGACSKKHSSEPVKYESDVDSISHIYGALLGGSLTQQLQQRGLYTDTASFTMQYQSQLATADSLQRDSLKTVFEKRLDSIVKANDRNIAQFIKGFKAGMKAKNSQEAYFAGMAQGSQMATTFSKQVDEAILAKIKKDKKFNRDLFVQSYIASAKGDSLKLMKEVRGTSQQGGEMFQKIITRWQEEVQAIEYGPNKEIGEKYIAEYAKQAGVQKLPTNEKILYKVITEGTGVKPIETDTVQVNYKGTLVDGTVFDQTTTEPRKFAVKGVIEGWSLSLLQMYEGSKWEIVIPYDLAYGSRDQGTIKPFSTLKFEVELIKVIHKK